MCVWDHSLYYLQLGNGQKKCSAKSKQNVHCHGKEHYSAGKTKYWTSYGFTILVNFGYIIYVLHVLSIWSGGHFVLLFFYSTGFLFFWLIGFYISGMSMCVCVSMCVSMSVCVCTCVTVYLWMDVLTFQCVWRSEVKVRTASLLFSTCVLSRCLSPGPHCYAEPMPFTGPGPHCCAG